MKDHLVKAVADGVRVYAAVTTDLVNEPSAATAATPSPPLRSAAR